MTSCSEHPDYDGEYRPRHACGQCSLLYMNRQTDFYLNLEWKTLRPAADHDGEARRFRGDGQPDTYISRK